MVAGSGPSCARRSVTAAFAADSFSSASAGFIGAAGVPQKTGSGGGGGGDEAAAGGAADETEFAEDEAGREGLRRPPARAPVECGASMARSRTSMGA